MRSSVYPLTALDSFLREEGGTTPTESVLLASLAAVVGLIVLLSLAKCA